MKLLFVTSEAFPLVKTGGLADVSGALPAALVAEGVDVRLLLPAYHSLEEELGSARLVAEMEVGTTGVRILQTTLPGTEVETWLLQHPTFSERPGNPYHDENGYPWPDNADRFMLLSRLAATICTQDTALNWRPDVLHCNDWFTGPAIALAHQSETRPRTIFTIHNLAHQGVFDRGAFERLQLPESLWQDLEYYGQFSFMKAGLVFADWITTVSPTYAREICESPGGMGLEGLLSYRSHRLVGVLNGIDEKVWNPAIDAHLPHTYDVDSLDDKVKNKSALQAELGLAVTDDRPLLGFVGRLTEQKGLELILPILQELLDIPVQVIVLGTGEAEYERRLTELAAANDGAMSVVLAYNETLAHRVEAASDIFLMPSLFEPCGLNQLYSLRYGTLPLVRGIGGLADTVTDASDANLAAGAATGFVFAEPEPGTLLRTVQRAVALWRDKTRWRAVQETAMAQTFSWQNSASRYLELYRS